MLHVEPAEIAALQNSKDCDSELLCDKVGDAPDHACQVVSSDAKLLSGPLIQ